MDYHSDESDDTEEALAEAARLCARQAYLADSPSQVSYDCVPQVYQQGFSSRYAPHIVGGNDAGVITNDFNRSMVRGVVPELLVNLVPDDIVALSQCCRELAQMSSLLNLQRFV